MNSGNMSKKGMLFVSPRGLRCRFLSYFRYLGRKANIFALTVRHQELIRAPDAPLKREKRLELKCVLQLSLGSLLGTRWSAIGSFFPALPSNSPSSLREGER